MRNKEKPRVDAAVWACSGVEATIAATTYRSIAAAEHTVHKGGHKTVHEMKLSKARAQDVHLHGARHEEQKQLL